VSAAALAPGIADAVAQQRATGGSRGVAFGPNLGSIDYADLFAHPEVWSDLRNQLSAFKVYGDSIHADSPSDKVGVNTYDAFRSWGLFARLREWDLPLHLEHGAIKEWEDPRRAPGEELREATLTAIARIRDAGGEVGVVCMDEPLTSKITADGEQHPGKWGAERVGDLARFTGEYVRAVASSGPGVALLEAYPHHPASRIDAFLRHIIDDNRTPLAFFEMDIDLFDISNKKLSERKLYTDFQLLSGTCRGRNIPFRIIASGTHAKTPKEYRKETFDILTLLRRLAVPIDGITVQSWTEYALRREIPPNLPRTDATSHLAILTEVLKLPWAAGQALPTLPVWARLVGTVQDTFGRS
jgi:hypothetical protein